MHTLYLGRNRLHGTFPSNIGELLPVLKIFDISNNGFSGTIPDSFSLMHDLDYFDVGKNLIVGTIPPALGELKHLQGLFLHDNKLIGTIPHSLIREDSKLVQLFLERNFLSGTIPIGMVDLKNLRDLYIDENKFTGTLPNELCNLNLNQAFYEGTDYDTPDRDGCESIACPTNTMSQQGVLPCYPCGPQVLNPYLGLAGRCYHQNERIILNKFFDETGGSEWVDVLGWGLDNVNQCEFSGVSCNSAGHVTGITLVNKGLKGNILEELGFLRHLRVLNLADNELDGFLPVSLKFASLEELDISGNKLEGFIPPTLCLTGDINGNGANGMFKCDFVACSAGYYSPTGYATNTDDGHVKSCLPCGKSSNAIYIGGKSCFHPHVEHKQPVIKAQSAGGQHNFSVNLPPFGPTLVVLSVIAIALFIRKNGSSFHIPSVNRERLNLPYSRRSRRTDDEDQVSSPTWNHSNSSFLSAIPRPNFANIPKPNLNGLKVAQAKMMDRLNLPQGRYSDEVSVDTSRAITSGISNPKDEPTEFLIGNDVGDDTSIASNVSWFTYAGDGADDDDYSMVCRSGMRQKEDDEKEINAIDRKIIDERPPLPHAKPELDEVSEIGSILSESSEESDESEEEEEEEDNEAKKKKVPDELSLLPLAENIPSNIETEEKISPNTNKDDIWFDGRSIS